MVAVIAGCGSASSPPGTQSTVAQVVAPPASSSMTLSATTAAPHEFASTRYEFRVILPQDWSETDAIVDWDGMTLSGPGSPFFANIADPAGGRTLMVAAAPVQPGTQLADWQAAMVRATPPVCPGPSTAQPTSIGGEPALAWTVSCSDGYDVNKLAVLHGQRGYIVYLPSRTANDDTEDQRIFEGIRQSFHFTS